MDSNLISYTGAICEGCLSVDRKLAVITDEDSLKIFCGFLEDKNQINQHLLLCWECAAIVRRVSSFKQQIRRAHNSLLKHMLHQTVDLSPLSKLSILQPDSWDINEENLQTNWECQIQPMTFIKVEYQDSLKDNLHLDDVRSADSEDCEETLKIDISADPFITKEPFDASDEEPLQEKKTRKKKRSKSDTSKTKKKRKKNEDKKEPETTEKPQSGPAVQYSTHSVNTLKKLNMADNEYMQLVVLTWEEVQEERQKALESEAFKRMAYRCYDCVLGFNHRFKLNNHMEKHKPEYGPEVCDICKIRCKQTASLVAHKKRHQVKWRCSLCGGAWSRASVAADHVSRAHGAAKPTHVCTICSQQFPSLNKLRLHMKEHSERVKCDLCMKTFVDRSAMKNHLFIHNGDKEFSCPHCDKKFLFKRAMELHRVTHDPDAMIYCHSCDMSFKNEMSYKQHMLYSLKHVDPARLKYACDLCNKRFVKAKRLEEHQVAVHLKTTPVKCTVPGCNFACSSRPVLRTHTRMLHRNARARRDHVCHVCGKAYTSKAALQGHLRAHSGERPFRCTRCPAAFGYEAALYNHTRLVHLKHRAGRSGTSEVPQTVTAATTATLAPRTETAVEPAGPAGDPRAMWPSLTPPPLVIPPRPSDSLTT